MAWDTAVNILNDAAVELGLYAADLTDPYDSTDPNIIQLCRLLKGLGQDMLRDHNWSHLSTRYSFNTANGTASYALPTPFGRFVDQTAYNTTQQLALRGPANAQDWEYLKAVNSAGVVYQVFSIFGDLFYIHPTPTAVEAIGYRYVSRYWVDAGGGSVPDSETPTDGTDTLFFDRRLLVLGLKLMFRGDKGFDAIKADGDFAAAYARAKAGDGAAPVLSLNGLGLSAFRLIDGRNVPDTGFGS